jgi:hypothetical protein
MQGRVSLKCETAFSISAFSLAEPQKLNWIVTGSVGHLAASAGAVNEPSPTPTARTRARRKSDGSRRELDSIISSLGRSFDHKISYDRKAGLAFRENSFPQLGDRSSPNFFVAGKLRSDVVPFVTIDRSSRCGKWRDGSPRSIDARRRGLSLGKDTTSATKIPLRLEPFHWPARLIDMAASRNLTIRKPAAGTLAGASKGRAWRV